MSRRVGNRFCVHPMEGWDADADGRPTRQSRRRWQALGRSGAKMLWNESVAVNPSGRSSPEQLLVAAHTGVGRPITDEPLRYWFGTDATGHHIDLGEPVALLQMLRDLSVELVSITGSSPYSAHHYQTPKAPTPGEHYINPENPLYGVARHLAVTAALKQAVPQLTYVGGGYSYLQQSLPHVAQPRVRRNQIDLIGIGRMHRASANAIPAMLAGRRPDLDPGYF